jgi:hypothetical protein
MLPNGGTAAAYFSLIEGGLRKRWEKGGIRDGGRVKGEACVGVAHAGARLRHQGGKQP